MDDGANIEAARQSVLQHFRWIDGDADTWTMLSDGDALRTIVQGLAHLAGELRPGIIAGVESRGFAIAPAVAAVLGIGFTPVRKEGAVFPGPVVHQRTRADYRGNQGRLSVRADHFSFDQRVVLIDDWVETGSQAIAASRLITACGAKLVGVVTIIDEARNDARSVLSPIRSLLAAEDLP